MENIYDLIIVGTGPAGYSASIYASRFKLNNLLIGELFGGTATQAHKIANFPSEEEISGIELMQKMQKNAQNLGAEVLMDKVTEINKNGAFFDLKTESGKVFNSKSIILAIGTKHRKLGLKNESEFVGKGVSYCATCDAMFFKDKEVAILGGSDSANTASVYLSDIAKNVYQIYKGKELRGDKTWIDQVLEKKNIHVIYETNVIELVGSKKLEKIKLDKDYNGNTELAVSGLFIEIGSEPEYGLIEKLNIKTDSRGFIDIKPDQSTNIDGIFAAGDITNGSNEFRQIITACSQGSIAANSVYKYIKLNHEQNS